MAQLRQYGDLLAAVKTRAPEAQARGIEARYQRITALKVLGLVCLLAALAFAFAQQTGPWVVALVAAVACYAAYISQLRKFQKGFQDLLMVKCDPAAAVDRLVVLAGHASARSWSLSYFNVGNALFFAGRFTEARHVAEILKKQGANETDVFLAEALGCRLCAQQGDIDGLDRHAAQMSAIASNGNRSPLVVGLYAELEGLPHLERLEAEGAYQEAYEFIGQRPQERRRALIDKVEDEYRLAYLADKLGMRREAAEHRQFVLENGGTTYFKRALSVHEPAEPKAVPARAAAREAVPSEGRKAQGASVEAVADAIAAAGARAASGAPSQV